MRGHEWGLFVTYVSRNGDSYVSYGGWNQDPSVAIMARIRDIFSLFLGKNGDVCYHA